MRSFLFSYENSFLDIPTDFVTKYIVEKNYVWRQNYKKLFRLLGLIVAFAIVLTTSFVASAETPLLFSDANIKIEFTNDEFVVSGSFASSASSASKYKVYFGSYDFNDALLELYASEPYSITAGTNTFTYNVGSIENAQRLKAFVWTDKMKAICEPVIKNHSVSEIKITYLNNNFVVNGKFTSSSNFNSIISSTTAIASKLFTKEEIPNGSIIVIDPGYAYHPEGWQTMDAKNANDRPATVTIPVVEVNNTWWGDYNYRAFNISHSNSTTINSVAEVASHFRIYVPKTAVTE